MPMQTFVLYIHIMCVSLVLIYAFHLPTIYIPLMLLLDIDTVRIQMVWP